MLWQFYVYTITVLKILSVNSVRGAGNVVGMRARLRTLEIWCSNSGRGRLS